MAEQKKCSMLKCHGTAEWLIVDPEEKVIGAYCAPHYAQQKAGIDKNPHLTARFIDTADHLPQEDQQKKDVTHQDRSILAPQQSSRGGELIEYTAFEGVNVALTVQMFREMLCPEASDKQSWYMLQWCAHNRIDPFANEAYFSVMGSKPVVQVSKDAWFKRMERHPGFSHHESGIIVETTLDHIKTNVMLGGDDYLVSEALKQSILEGKEQEKKIPPRFTAKKKSHYLDAEENLLGGWAAIYRKDRAQPYSFSVNKEGWEQKTSQGGENVFWKAKAPFMIWKTALKNCTRLAFPELSGLLNAPEAREELTEIADAEFTAPNSNEQKKALFAIGKRVPAPLGPLAYPELHALAGELYGGKGISELSMREMGQLIELASRAVEGDEQTLRDLCVVLKREREEIAETVAIDFNGAPAGGVA